MNITAKEAGRSLVITLGADTEGLSPEDAEVAAQSAVRFVIPPVDAMSGARMWAHYSSILFLQADDDALSTGEEMTKRAVGAWADEDAPQEERDRADAQWARLNALRSAEATQVAQLALYWNSQGGGMDVVEAMLRDGHPKAQEVLMTSNQVWSAYSTLRTSLTSMSGDAASGIPSRAASTRTSTRSGSSAPVERDAFGISRSA